MQSGQTNVAAGLALVPFILLRSIRKATLSDTHIDSNQLKCVLKGGWHRSMTAVKKSNTLNPLDTPEKMEGRWGLESFTTMIALYSITPL